MPKLKLEPQKDKILNMFDNGLSVAKIAKQINEYEQAVSNLIKRYKNIKTFQHDQGNVRYFNNIDTHTKAYLLGFIAADGCIQSNNNGSIGLTITIHSKDRIVLDTLRDEIGCTNPVHKLKIHDHVRFTLFNKDLVADLNKHGIEKRKSLTMPNIITNIPYDFKSSFILGYFDGNGSFTYQPKYNRGYIQIRATKAFALGIVNHLEISPYGLYEYNSIPNLSIGAKKNIKKFFLEVYKNSTIYLNRKHNKIKSFVNTLCQD